MAQPSLAKKSLTDQIIEETMAALENAEDFDSQTIEQLRQLATKGELKKAPQVAKAIKPA